MELAQLQALVAILRTGSFLSAAEALGLSRPTLRARIAALEEEVGVPLLVRGPRGVAPTEAGGRLADGAGALLRDADALLAAARAPQTEVIGELRTLGPPGSLPPMMGALMVSQLRQRYPELKLSFSTGLDPAGDSAAAADLVLYFGEDVPEGPFRTFALLRFPVHLLASRAYLDARGRPTCVEDLAGHELLCWSPPGGDGDAWPLRSGGKIKVDYAVMSSEVLSLRTQAAAGLGIALLPDAPIAQGTVPGEDFEVVLPERIGREGALRVLLREHTANTGRTRAITRLLREIAGGLFGVIPGDLLPFPEDPREALPPLP